MRQSQKLAYFCALTRPFTIGMCLICGRIYLNVVVGMVVPCLCKSGFLGLGTTVWASKKFACTCGSSQLLPLLIHKFIVRISIQCMSSTCWSIMHITFMHVRTCTSCCIHCAYTMYMWIQSTQVHVDRLRQFSCTYNRGRRLLILGLHSQEGM